MTDAYDKDLGALVSMACKQVNLDSSIIRQGTYVMVSGPSYETRSESSMLRKMGADAVGMSTVPEVIVARHGGLRVLGLALITNNVITLENENSGISKPTHEEVLETSSKRSKDMQALITSIVELMQSQPQ